MPEHHVNYWHLFYTRSVNYLCFNPGELKPIWKSLPIPTKQDGPVQVLVADNFETEVYKSKSDRDIALYIYAPW